MNRKYKSLLADTFVFALGSLGSKIILFLLVPLYTNYLSTSEYGTADLITTFSQLMIPIASLIKKNQKPQDVLLAAFFVFAFTIIATIVAWPLIGLYSAIAPWRLFLSLYVVFSVLCETEKAYLKVKNNRSYAIISVLQTLTLALTNIVLLTYFHLGVKGYLISNITAVGLTSVMAFWASNSLGDLKTAQYDKKLLNRMLAYSAPLILNNMSW